MYSMRSLCVGMRLATWCFMAAEADYRDMRTALYIRAQASKPDQALEAARKAFGEITALHCEDAPADEIAFITPQDTERELQAKLAGINGLTLQSVIRMTDY